MNRGVGQIRKAIVAGVGSMLALLSTAVMHRSLSSWQLAEMVIESVTLGFLTWLVDNDPADIPLLTGGTSMLTTAPTTSTVRGTVPVDQA